MYIGYRQLAIKFYLNVTQQNNTSSRVHRPVSAISLCPVELCLLLFTLPSGVTHSRSISSGFWVILATPPYPFPSGEPRDEVADNPRNREDAGANMGRTTEYSEVSEVFMMGTAFPWEQSILKLNIMHMQPCGNRASYGRISQHCFPRW